MSREWTTQEIRQQFLERVYADCRYWDSIPKETTLEKLEGLAFSILVILDGGTDLPGFIVAPRPHEDDKEFNKNEGSNWYPENHEIEDQISGDISGGLHEDFCNIRKDK